MEEWKDIKGWEGLYQVSNCGNVRSLPRKVSGKLGSVRQLPMKLIRPRKTTWGYFQVVLHFNGKNKAENLHRLVYTHFKGEITPGQEINHIDGNKINNKVTNLEQCTRSENMKHAFKIGLKKADFGEGHSRSKLASEAILQIRANTTDSHTSLGKAFGVSRVQIRNIRNRKQWRHI